MSQIKQDWDDWVDGSAPGNEPIRLRDDAPEKIKKQFEEWKKRKSEEEAKGWYI